MKSNKKLSKLERVRLYELQRLGYGCRAIARELNRSHSTVVRELKRNAKAVDPHGDYITQANQANDIAHERRIAASKKKMRLKNLTIRHYTEFHLKQAHWSPEIIAGKLTSLGYKITAEAIYQFINTERPDLKSCLLVAGKSRRRRRSGKKHRIRPIPAAPKRSIEQLPVQAKERQLIGHLELDAIVGKRGSRSAIQNKTDRCSRKMFLDKVATLEAEPYAETLITRMKASVPKGVLKTILEDNGSEHADHQRVDQELGTLSHFCHPYCASERGSVENRNKAIRRFLPKGTNFDEIPDEFIEWIEVYFNNTPMKVLKFKTPDQVWQEQINQFKKAA
jgi:IS30 family transposase